MLVGVSGRFGAAEEAKVFGVDGRLSGKSSAEPTSATRLDAGSSVAEGSLLRVVGGCGRTGDGPEDCAY